MLRESEAPTLLVTHDFAEAAQLGDRVGIIDRGRVVQLGTPSELAARPRSAFVADFTGAVVLTGVARAGAGGVTRRAGRRGDDHEHRRRRRRRRRERLPWEIGIEPAGAEHGSAENRLAAEVVSITTVGSRVRLGLVGPSRWSPRSPWHPSSGSASARRPGGRRLEGLGDAAGGGLTPAAVQAFAAVLFEAVRFLRVPELGAVLWRRWASGGSSSRGSR